MSNRTDIFISHKPRRWVGGIIKSYNKDTGMYEWNQLVSNYQNICNISDDLIFTAGTKIIRVDYKKVVLETDNIIARIML